VFEKLDFRQFKQKKSISISQSVENIPDKNWELRFNQHRLMG